MLRERGYFEDHLDKLETDGRAFIKKVEGYIHDYYTINGVIGDVYDSKARLATHKQSGLERAIKIVEKSSIENVEEYLKQVQMVSTLDHPNIVKYFEYFESDTQYFFVSEYMKGGDLWNGVMTFGG